MQIDHTKRAELERMYDEVLAELDVAGQDQAKIRELFERTVSLAESGYVEAAGLLGELQALEPAVHDAEAAYRWYYIDAAIKGTFSTSYKNEASDDAHYTGPPGDFRNEPLVADMIDLFGAERIPELDQQARVWLERLGDSY
jgi:hypothetical protein